MPVNGLFHKLIRWWFLLRQQGMTLTSADLCRDCPEHQEEVERSLQGLLALECRTSGQAGPEPNGATGTHLALSAIPPAAVTSPVSRVLLRWQEHHEHGVDLSADELCQDCPEHLEEVSARLQALRAFCALLGAVDEPCVSPAAKALPDVPGYQILEPLGEGGMALVWKARQIRLDRVVALKMIRDGGYARADTLARFRTEAEAIARLQHPNIVQVFEVGEHDGRPFLAMEFCPGGGLDRKLAGTALPPQEAAELLRTLALATEAAHRARVVHRDLKPANILLAADGTPKISDFGLARKLDEAGQTQTGAVMGTPSYMAPEQARAEETVGPAADVYALGAILYELLTGQPPFRGSTTHNTIQQVLTQEPAAPRRRNPKVPRDLEAICLICLEKEPARRYASAAALAEDLRRFQAGDPVAARPAGSLERGWRWCRRNRVVAASLTVVAVALVTATVVSVLFGLRAEEARQAEAGRAISEAAANREANQARRDAQRQLIDQSAATGLMASREGDDSLALLWIARAVQLAKEEPEMQELNRIRFANWRRQVSLPEGTFAIPGFRQDHYRLQTFQFSPNGEYLLLTGSTGDCLVWDRPRQRLISLPKAAAKGSPAAWQPGSGLLAVAEKGGAIRLLAPPEFRPVDKVEAGQEITVLEFSRDGKRLAWGGADGARVWDSGKKEYVTSLLAHGGPVTSLSFSAAGDLLATSARDLKARVFRVAPGEGEPLFPPVPHTLGEYVHFLIRGGPDRVAPRFATDDKCLLTVQDSPGGNFRLVWRSATTGKPLAGNNISQGREFLWTFAVSPQGKRVATIWPDTGLLWDGDTRQPYQAIPAPLPWSHNQDVIFTSDGKKLVTCSTDSTVRFWFTDYRSGVTLIPSHPSISHSAPVVRVSLSNDDRHLATALSDGMICLWRLPEGPPKGYLLPAGGVTLPALSSDGKFVLPRGASNRSGTQLETRVYGAESGMPAGPTLDLGGILLDAAFSPDGIQVATASSTARTPAERNQRLFEPEGKAGSVQLWDWRSGKRLAGPIPTPGEPRGLAFGSNGRSLAVVCADYRVLLIDPRNGTILHSLDPRVRTRQLGNANQWWSNGEARFSPDGSFLATWEMSPHVHIWDPESGRLLHTLPHKERVQHVAFSPTTPALLATGGWDRVVRIWDLTAGKLLVELQHPQGIIRLQFSPDGTELISSCGDGRLRVWDWKAGKLKDGLSLHPFLLQDFAFTADRRWLVSLGSESLQVTDWRTKTAAGPLWNLKPSFNLQLAIPAGERRAIVGNFSGSLVGYDLEKMVAPTLGPTEDWEQLAELAAGRRILSQGNVVPLTSAEWAERWQRLQRDGSPFLPGRSP